MVPLSHQSGAPKSCAFFSIPLRRITDYAAEDQMSYAAAIRTRGLSKDYGEGHGLFDLDLEVEESAARFLAFSAPRAQASRGRNSGSCST